MQVINAVRLLVRRLIRALAQSLNKLSNGRITPDMVTTIGAVMHVPIALLIAFGHLTWAGVLAIIFGLFDVLDGELARLQKKASVRGMFYDVSTDRIKEVLLYTGSVYYLVHSHMAQWAYVAVIAFGAINTVTYIKTKGEVGLALKQKITDHHKLNRYFNEGLVPFEIRNTILIVGLLFHQLVAAIVLVAVLGTISVFERLYAVSREL